MLFGWWRFSVQQGCHLTAWSHSNWTAHSPMCGWALRKVPLNSASNYAPVNDGCRSLYANMEQVVGLLGVESVTCYNDGWNNKKGTLLKLSKNTTLKMLPRSKACLVESHYLEDASSAIRCTWKGWIRTSCSSDEWLSLDVYTALVLWVA